MVDFREIYHLRADEYHDMITVEDFDQNLKRALTQLVPSLPGSTDPLRILDLGSGTGRVELLLKECGSKLFSLEISRTMLTRQALARAETHGAWHMLQGDIQSLPWAASSFDLVTAGWSIGHQIGWHPDNWPERVDRILAEMGRVLIPGGISIIIETMTTGATVPAPPNDGLAAYYRRLEEKWGFQKTILRTDYQFSSVDDAVRQMEFFFGPELSDRIRQEHWLRVPEWTGLWVKSNAS
jgi:ubiquinone/menaquinone biosynthesis C-methylase UbiE